MNKVAESRNKREGGYVGRHGQYRSKKIPTLKSRIKKSKERKRKLNTAPPEERLGIALGFSLEDICSRTSFFGDAFFPVKKE
jgi:hypothetical protein